VSQSASIDRLSIDHTVLFSFIFAAVSFFFSLTCCSKLQTWFEPVSCSAESEVIQLRDSALLSVISLVAATRGPTVQSQGHPQVQRLSSDAGPVTWPADSDTQAATQQYQPVGSAAAVQASDVTHISSCDELEALAEAVMQQGCLDEEGRAAQLMKPFLPGVLRALSEVPNASRYGRQAMPVGGLYACLSFQV